MSQTTDAQNPGKFADVNGLRMYYEIHGTGEPIVLIHGGGSTIPSNFAHVIPLLSKTRKVIAVELQAHGRTSDREGPETFDQDAADVVELLNQLNIERADILGFSNGGQTTLVLGMKHPARVRKLIVASAFYKRAGTFDGFWDMFGSPKFSDMPQILKDEFLKVNNDPHALENMFNKDAARMNAFEGWTDDEIRSISAPTLIVNGDRDVATNEHAVEMSRVIANSRLAILPGNHGSYLGESMSPVSPAVAHFVELVNEFLDEK